MAFRGIKMTELKPEVMGVKLLGMSLCVSKDWTNEQVIDFAEKNNPCGTTAGWQVHEALGRVKCSDKLDYIHIVVHA